MGAIKKLLLVIASLLWIIAMMLLFRAKDCSAGEIRASWYSEQSLKQEGTWKTSHGIMANGKQFDETAMTCACRMFRLGATIRVTNLETGKSVVVKVTDRIGKRFATTRIDLSKGAFSKIAMLKKGTVPIKVEEL